MLLLRSYNWQAFAFGPSERARRPGVGLDVRHRRMRVPGVKRTSVWRHHKLGVYWARADLRKGRGTLTLEYAFWLTSPGVIQERISLKSGVRLKLLSGGALESAEAVRQRKIAGLD